MMSKLHDDLEVEQAELDSDVPVDHFGDLSETSDTLSKMELNTLDDPLGKNPEIGEWTCNNPNL